MYETAAHGPLIDPASSSRSIVAALAAASQQAKNNQLYHCWITLWQPDPNSKKGIELTVVEFKVETMANPNHQDFSSGIKVVANGRDGYIAREQDGTTNISSENLVYDESTMHKVNICWLLIHSGWSFIY